MDAHGEFRMLAVGLGDRRPDRPVYTIFKSL